MKILKSLIMIAGILIICDIITTIIGLNAELVESNLITNAFLTYFGIIPGLIISSILKFSMIIILLIISKIIKIPHVNTCVVILTLIAIITTFQAILNNILLISKL